MGNGFKAGAGRRDITPEVGCMLYGYAPARPSTCVHDPLHITVFMLEQDGEQAIMASADLCVVRGKVNDDIRKAMSEATGVPVDHIMLSAIHTHSGPVMDVDADRNSCNPEYHYGLLLPAAVEAAKEAKESLRPAEMGIGYTDSQVAVNRRQMKPDGKVILGQEPLGLYDPKMTVVSFRDLEGNTIGNMVHYGCHNTGSGKNPEITRDWCGVMIDRMDQLTGGITAFFNGCQGDCGPRLANGKTTGNLQLALELGGRAAIDGMTAWRSIREWRSDVPLRFLTGTIDIPYDPMPTEEWLDAKLAEIPDPVPQALLHEYHGYLSKKAFLKRPEAKEEVFHLNISVMAFGPLAIVPIPYETFSGITMRISRHSPFPETLCISNGNDGLGYFPTQDQLCRGGYEINAFKIFRAHPLVDNADQMLVSGALELLKQLDEQGEED